MNLDKKIRQNKFSFFRRYTKLSITNKIKQIKIQLKLNKRVGSLQTSPLISSAKLVLDRNHREINQHAKRSQLRNMRECY